MDYLNTLSESEIAFLDKPGNMFDYVPYNFDDKKSAISKHDAHIIEWVISTQQRQKRVLGLTEKQKLTLKLTKQFGQMSPFHLSHCLNVSASTAGRKLHALYIKDVLTRRQVNENNGRWYYLYGVK